MRKRPKTDATSVLPTQGAPGSFGVSGSFGVTESFGAPESFGVPEPMGAGAAETIIVRVRRHGRHLVPAIALLLVVAGAAGFFIGWFPELWMNLTAAGVAAALALFGGIGPILGWLSHRTVVTSRRVIVHRGFFVRHRSEVSLARVREVRTKQNLIQRMWGSGDLDLYVGVESTRIQDAPRVKELHAALQELSERSYDEQLRAASFGF